MTKIKRIIEIEEYHIKELQEYCKGEHYGQLRFEIISSAFSSIAHSKPYDNSGDLISREALKETLRSYPQTDDMRTTELIGFFEKLIDNAQAVQAFTLEDMQNNAEGEWINQGGGFSWVFKCSCCGWVDGYPLNERHKYCPNCGADMQKGGAE